jgi:hypothetical protein
MSSLEALWVRVVAACPDQRVWFLSRTGYKEKDLEVVVDYWLMLMVPTRGQGPATSSAEPMEVVTAVVAVEILEDAVSDETL